jgi:prevent-host-death family protein
MQTISAAEFKARCLTLMDDVNRTRETLVITKRGKPVARLVPADDTGCGGTHPVGRDPEIHGGFDGGLGGFAGHH